MAAPGHAGGDKHFFELTDCPDVTDEKVLSELGDRFARNVFYTQCGDCLVYVNPNTLDLPAVHGEGTMYQHTIIDSDFVHSLPPHLFKVTRTAHVEMMKHRAAKAVALLGDSGSGKSALTRIMSKFFLAVVPEHKNASLTEKVIGALDLLDVVCSRKTACNAASTCLGKSVKLYFSDDGRPVSARMDVLLDSFAVKNPGPGERSFSLLYQLLCGATGNERTEFELGSPSSYRFLSQSKCWTIPGVSDASDASRTRALLRLLGVDADREHDIVHVISVILFLGNLEWESTDHGLSLVDAEAVYGSLAFMFSVDPDLAYGAFGNFQSEAEGRCAVDEFAVLLYESLVQWIVGRVNETLLAELPAGAEIDENLSITVLDTGGLQREGNMPFAGYLRHYVAERVQNVFRDVVFKQPQRVYEEEGINWVKLELDDRTDMIAIMECVMNIERENMDEPAPKLRKMIREQLEDFHRRKLLFFIDDKSESEFRLSHFGCEVSYSPSGFREYFTSNVTAPFYRLVEKGGSEFLKTLFKERLANPELRELCFVDRMTSHLNRILSDFRNCSAMFVGAMRSNVTGGKRELDLGVINKQIGGLCLTSLCEMGHFRFAHVSTFEDFFERFKFTTRRTFPEFEGSACEGCKTIMFAAQLTVQDFECGPTKIFVRRHDTYRRLEALLDSAMQRYATLIQKMYRRWSGKAFLRDAQLIANRQLRGKKDRRRETLNRAFLGNYFGHDGHVSKLMHSNILNVYPDERLLFADEVSVMEKKGKFEDYFLIITSRALYSFNCVRRAEFSMEGRNPLFRPIDFYDLLDRRVEIAKIGSLTMSTYIDEYLLIHPANDPPDILLFSDLKRTEILGVLMKQFKVLTHMDLLVLFVDKQMKVVGKTKKDTATVSLKLDVRLQNIVSKRSKLTVFVAQALPKDATPFVLYEECGMVRVPSEIQRTAKREGEGAKPASKPPGTGATEIGPGTLERKQSLPTLQKAGESDDIFDDPLGGDPLVRRGTVAAGADPRSPSPSSSAPSIPQSAIPVPIATGAKNKRASFRRTMSEASLVPRGGPPRGPAPRSPLSAEGARPPGAAPTRPSVAAPLMASRPPARRAPGLSIRESELPLRPSLPAPTGPPMRQAPKPNGAPSRAPPRPSFVGIHPAAEAASGAPSRPAPRPGDPGAAVPSRPAPVPGGRPAIAMAGDSTLAIVGTAAKEDAVAKDAANAPTGVAAARGDKSDDLPVSSAAGEAPAPAKPSFPTVVETSIAAPSGPPSRPPAKPAAIPRAASESGPPTHEAPMPAAAKPNTAAGSVGGPPSRPAVLPDSLKNDGGGHPQRPAAAKPVTGAPSSPPVQAAVTNPATPAAGSGVGGPPSRPAAAKPVTGAPSSPSVQADETKPAAPAAGSGVGGPPSRPAAAKPVTGAPSSPPVQAAVTNPATPAAGSGVGGPPSRPAAAKPVTGAPSSPSVHAAVCGAVSETEPAAPASGSDAEAAGGSSSAPALPMGGKPAGPSRPTAAKPVATKPEQGAENDAASVASSSLQPDANSAAIPVATAIRAAASGAPVAAADTVGSQPAGDSATPAAGTPSVNPFARPAPDSQTPAQTSPFARPVVQQRSAAPGMASSRPSVVRPSVVQPPVRPVVQRPPMQRPMVPPGARSRPSVTVPPVRAPTAKPAVTPPTSRPAVTPPTSKPAVTPPASKPAAAASSPAMPSSTATAARTDGGAEPAAAPIGPVTAPTAMPNGGPAKPAFSPAAATSATSATGTGGPEKPAAATSATPAKPAFSPAAATSATSATSTGGPEKPAAATSATPAKPAFSPAAATSATSATSTGGPEKPAAATSATPAKPAFAPSAPPSAGVAQPAVASPTKPAFAPSATPVAGPAKPAFAPTLTVGGAGTRPAKPAFAPSVAGPGKSTTAPLAAPTAGSPAKPSFAASSLPPPKPSGIAPVSSSMPPKPSLPAPGVAPPPHPGGAPVHSGRAADSAQALAHRRMLAARRLSTGGPPRGKAPLINRGALPPPPGAAPRRPDQ